MPHIPGAVLPTVMVVSILLLLVLLGVAALWEADYLFFSKHRYEAMQRAHVESGFTLYGEYPAEVVSGLDADSTLVLYDSLPQSRIKIEVKPWGLYEAVGISGAEGKIKSSKILGKRTLYKEDISFYYKNNNSALTLTGRTNLKGNVRLPRNGGVYGQMGSVFFNGEKLETARMKESDKDLPEPDADILSHIQNLLEITAPDINLLPGDSIRNSFFQTDPLILDTDGRLDDCYLSGNIIFTGGDIEIGASCRFHDIIAVGRKIRIGEGFTGSLQAFASDSLCLEGRVTLSYPSGLYSSKYISIGDRSEINGYAIVNIEGALDVRKANYVQSRLATVRGLVYVSGIAQLQGIVSGAVFIEKAVYYSPRGYYENMIYDVTLLENNEMAWPLWFGGAQRRKEAKWVN